MFNQIFKSAGALSLALSLSSIFFVGCSNDTGTTKALDGCAESPKELECACENTGECGEGLVCISGACSNCTESEGCLCGSGDQCAEDLTCSSSGICERLISIDDDDMGSNEEMGPVDECSGDEVPLGCACDDETACAAPAQCREGTCIECAGELDCPCTSEGTCQEGLVCGGSGQCEPCGNEGLSCCDQDEAPQCGEGLTCNDTGTCDVCVGDQGCPCDADRPCSSGLFCGEENICSPCGAEDARCCPEGDSPQCSDGLRCGDEGSCVACMGEQGCLCDESTPCAEGLKCGDSGRCEPCGLAGTTCCDAESSESTPCGEGLECNDQDLCQEPCMEAPFGLGCACADDTSCRQMEGARCINGACSACPFGTLDCFCGVGSACDEGLSCGSQGLCELICGGQDEQCCLGDDVNECDSGLVCRENSCQPCGSEGSLCCENSQCDDQLACGESGLCELPCQQAPFAQGCSCAFDSECTLPDRCVDGVCNVCPVGEDGCYCGIGQTCDDDLTCRDGICGIQCGADGQDCCPDDYPSACDDGLSCHPQSGQCVPLCSITPLPDTCACEQDDQCQLTARCLQGACTECPIGLEHCYCGIASSCADDLSCVDGLCERACGDLNEECCPESYNEECGEGLTCGVGGQCELSCGDEGEACCPGRFGFACAGDLRCEAEVCVQPPPPCGTVGETCCDIGDPCSSASLRCNTNNICEDCTGELSCACDNGQCDGGRCEADLCVDCAGEPGCECNNGQCTDGLCNSDNRCVACEGQENCACVADADCQAGLDCVTLGGSSFCFSCAGQENCVCDQGSCAGDLVCQDNQCVSAPCPEGTEDCPCRVNGRACDGFLNCVDRDGDGQNICENCVGEVGCYCGIGANPCPGDGINPETVGQCNTGTGLCDPLCRGENCPCEADANCDAPYTCEQIGLESFCVDCRGQLGCACDANGECSGDAACNANSNECVTFESYCATSRGPGCECNEALNCAEGSICDANVCVDCAGRGDLEGCACPAGPRGDCDQELCCDQGFYCDRQSDTCAQGRDCSGQLGVTCADQGRLCVAADGYFDADCSVDCLPNLVEINGACTDCSAFNQAGCPCADSCDASARLFCSDATCALASQDVSSCAAQLRSFIETDGAQDARCDVCLEDAREPLAGESPAVEGGCISCIGEVGCSCDADEECSGDARCDGGTCISFEEACNQADLRGEGCACDDTTPCAEGNRCESDICVDCVGEIGCICDDAQDPPSCDGTAQCIDGECVSFEEFCDNSRVEGCACDASIQCAAGFVCGAAGTCLSCEGRADLEGCGCINGACDASSNLYCLNELCVTTGDCSGVAGQECASQYRQCVQTDGQSPTRCSDECDETNPNVISINNGEGCHNCTADLEGCACINDTCASQNTAYNQVYCNGGTCASVTLQPSDCGPGEELISTGRADASCECITGSVRVNGVCFACDPTLPQYSGCSCDAAGCNADQNLTCVGGLCESCDQVIDNGVCREKQRCDTTLFCGDLESCVSSGSELVDDECVGLCNDNLCAGIENSSGAKLGQRALGGGDIECLCEPAPGYYYSTEVGETVIVSDTNVRVKKIKPCDEDRDGWINVSSYLKSSMARSSFDGLSEFEVEVINANRCEIGVISKMRLIPSRSPRAEPMTQRIFERSISALNVDDELNLGLNEDFVVMVEPDNIDKLIRSSDQNLEYNGTPLAPSALNALTKACGASTDLNANGASDFSEQLNFPLNPADYNTALRYVGDLMKFMRRTSYFVELYQGRWIDCDSAEEICPQIQAALPENIDLKPRVYELVERHRIAHTEDDTTELPFVTPTDGTASDYVGWRQCAVYGDKRAEGEGQMIGMEFSRWKWPSAEVDGRRWISGEGDAYDSAISSNDALTTEAFRSVFKHHSQFKCLRLVSAGTFANSCAEAIAQQDSYVYIGDENDVTYPAGCDPRPEQRLYKSNSNRSERFARQLCTLNASSQPAYQTSGANEIFEASLGNVTDLAFDCSHDTDVTIDGSKTQWAIVGYRGAQDSGLRSASEDPMAAYIRGCVNESVAQRGRFFRECAGYGIFDRAVPAGGSSPVSCSTDYDCRAFAGTTCVNSTCLVQNGSDLGDPNDIRRFNNSLDVDVTCDEVSECRSGETCEGGFCRNEEGRVVNRRRDAIKRCIDDMFDRAELKGETSPALEEKMRGPYVCHGFDYEPSDALAFKASAGSASNEYNGMLRCGCVDGYNGVNADGALDCSFGCLDEHLFIEGPTTESEWFDEVASNDGSRYDKFIKPPYEHWICMESGVNGYEVATTPKVTCSADGDCASDESCVSGTCTPSALFAVEAGVPTVIMMDPGQPIELP